MIFGGAREAPAGIDRGRFMRLLVVEDDVKIASFIVKGLRQEGYAVDHAADGPKGLEMALGQSYDAAVIDLMLPGLDGLSLIEGLRRAERTTPVIILSARRSVDERVQGLQAGGDDYLTKPFAFSELSARMRALLRRSRGYAEPAQMSYADLEMDLLRREVSRGGKPIELQPLEFSLLAYLMRHAGQVVTRTMIIEQVWNYHFDPQTNVVDARICRLREKIDKQFSRKLIQTIRGVGYALREDA